MNKTAEQFLRDNYKLVDFKDLTINGKSWIELMDEFSQQSLAYKNKEIDELNEGIDALLFYISRDKKDLKGIIETHRYYKKHSSPQK
jgi:hypothetical protein